MTTDGGGWTRFAADNSTFIYGSQGPEILNDFGVDLETPEQNFCFNSYKNTRDLVSATGECEYLIKWEGNGSPFALKMSTIFQKGTNSYANSNIIILSGKSTIEGYITEFQMNNLPVGYWEGVAGGNPGYSRGDVGQPCKDRQFNVYFSTGFGIDTSTFSTSGSDSRCSNWCGRPGADTESYKIFPNFFRQWGCFQLSSDGGSQNVVSEITEVTLRFILRETSTGRAIQFIR